MCPEPLLYVLVRLFKSNPAEGRRRTPEPRPQLPSISSQTPSDAAFLLEENVL